MILCKRLWPAVVCLLGMLGSNTLLISLQGGENALRPLPPQHEKNALRFREPVSPVRRAQYTSPVEEESLVPYAQDELAASPSTPVDYDPYAACEPQCGCDMPEMGRMHQPQHMHQRPGEMVFLERLHHTFAGHTDPNDPGRHFGIGKPLIGTSWLNHPWYVSGFLGGITGDELQTNSIEQGGGFFAGARFGADFDHFWGLEARFAAADLNTNFENSLLSGNSRNTFFDINMLYYPLGDTKWRPYLSLGLGLGNFAYEDELATKIRATAIGMPFSAGMKYHLSPRAALRFEVTDNFTFATGSQQTTDSMHNISFTAGFEYHFGGQRIIYGPW